jgi:hypothetical protein
MAEILGEITGTRKQSMARVEVFTPAHLSPDDWEVAIHFENAEYDAAGNLVPGTQVFGAREVRRKFGAVKGDPEVVALVAKIKEKGYEWRAEDIQAAAAAAAERENG